MLALKVLRQVMEEKLNAVNVEVCVVSTATRAFRIYSPQELQTVIDRLPPPEVNL